MKKNEIRYFTNPKSKVSYVGIPASVIEKSAVISDDLIGCAYAIDWSYEYREGVKYLVFTFNAEEEFLFDKLYVLDGKLNEELYDLLTETESIRLCDRKIDFDRILMRNVNFTLRVDKKTGLYNIENLRLVEGSYGENLGAFYDIDEIFKKLAQPPEEDDCCIEFEYGTGSEISYTETLAPECFGNESLIYQPSEKIYSLKVAIIEAHMADEIMEDEKYFYLTFSSGKNVYKARVKINDFLFSFLIRIGAFDIRKEMLGLDLSAMFSARLVMDFKLVDNGFQSRNIRVLTSDEEYWDSLFKQAEAENQN